MRYGAFYILIFTNCFTISAQQDEGNLNKTIKFVSFPDFFNFDIPNPWPEYEDTVNYFLNQISDEKPSFVLVIGDSMHIDVMGEQLDRFKKVRFTK